MSRILPLAGLALLVSSTLACGGDDAGTPTAPPTIPVGGVLDVFPSEPGAGPSTVPERSAVPPTDPPATSEPSRTTTSTLQPAPPTTVPAPTSFVSELAELAPGPPAEPGATELLTDDTGRLSMEVPADWSERSTSAGRLPDGSAAPYLAASPDLRRFLDGYEAAGMTVVVLGGDDDVAAALDSYRFDEDCAADGVRPWVGEAVEGEFAVFRDCGGTDTDIVTVVVEPPGRVGTVLVLAQIREAADLVALDTAMATMQVGR